MHWHRFLGIVCLVVGIVGLFLPFIQGVALILVGLGLLGVIEWKKKN